MSHEIASRPQLGFGECKCRFTSSHVVAGMRWDPQVCPLLGIPSADRAERQGRRWVVIHARPHARPARPAGAVPARRGAFICFTTLFLGIIRVLKMFYA